MVLVGISLSVPYFLYHADKHPAVVNSLQRMAVALRQKLGDSLTGVKGSEVREPGRTAL
jgi:hypothetical protein